MRDYLKTFTPVTVMAQMLMNKMKSQDNIKPKMTKPIGGPGIKKYRAKRKKANKLARKNRKINCRRMH